MVIIKEGVYSTIFAFYHQIRERGGIRPGRIDTDLFETQPNFVYVLELNQFRMAFEVAISISNRVNRRQFRTKEDRLPYVLRLNLEDLGFEKDPFSPMFRFDGNVDASRITDVFSLGSGGVKRVIIVR